LTFDPQTLTVIVEVHFMKRQIITLFLLAGVAFRIGAMGAKAPAGLSLILVLAQPNLIQVARDMSDMGEALMMSYSPKAPAATPFLHIWDGQRWLPVSPDKFMSGTFLTNPTTRMVVVGEENDRTAVLIEQALNWCPEVLHMETSNVTELINQLGKVYDFSRSDWEWIAQRYQLQLEDLTKNLPRESWYDTHTSSDVPQTAPPWRQKKQSTVTPPPPATSLTPLEDDLPETYNLELE
jgi:hypothetical protein